MPAHSQALASPGMDEHGRREEHKPAPLTEAEQLHAAFQELGLNLPFEVAQERIRAAKSSGMTVDDWMGQNLRNALAEPIPDDDSD